MRVEFSVECICAYCGRMRRRPPSQADRPYCSRACFNAARWERGPERFAEHVLQTPTCWPWAGRLFDDQPYGQFSMGGRPVRAHVYAWGMASGAPVPKGMLVCHVCDTPACVRHDGLLTTYVVAGMSYPRYGHLWLGDHAANMRDMVAKGRAPSGADHPLRLHPERAAHPIGEANPRAKLTADTVRAIRRSAAAGERYRIIANRYCIGIPTVSMIVNRHSWPHID